MHRFLPIALTALIASAPIRAESPAPGTKRIPTASAGRPTSGAGWSKTPRAKSEAYVINERMTPAGFAKFCLEHADAEELHIDGATRVTDMTPVAGLVKLRKLRLNTLTAFSSDEHRVDLAPLATLTELESLDCHATRVIGMEALKSLTKLRSIDFYMSAVDSLEPPAELGLLESLDLYGYAHAFRDYAPLAGQPIRHLNVYMNKQATPRNLAVLRGDRALESFSANLAPGVTSIEFLAESPALKSVELWNDPVSDLSPLEGKTKLTHLNLRGTKVTDLTPLAGCTELATLNLSGTAVTDIAPLLGLKKLRIVKLPRGVTEAQAEELRRACPGVFIEPDRITT